MRARLKLFIPLALFTVMAVFLFRGLSLDPRELPSALIDHAFPEFSLSNLSGERQMSRADVTGEVVLFNVWATWCISCRVEHSYLQQLADTGVKIYGVNYKDDSAAARQWLRELGDPYVDNIADVQGSLGLDLGVYGAPETYFVDRQGIIRYRHVGVIGARVWETLLQPIYEQLQNERASG